MSTENEAMPQLVVARENLFDPPFDHDVLSPVCRMRFPSGTSGWGVVGYRHALELFADPRLSSDQTLVDHPLRPGTGTWPDGPPAGGFVWMDPPQHTRFRRALSAHFSARAVHALQAGVGRIVDECLDGLSRAGRGADLVASFALPMPTLVICELLGVDYSARDHFQRITRGMQYVDATPEEVRAAYGECREFMTEVIREKRATPDDALVSALVHDTDLTDEEILDVSIILLMAGLDTTTNMLGLGTFALLQNPKQWRLLRERPDLLDGAVEELLRYLSISALTIIRVAKEDFTFAGQAIKAGDTVLLLLSAANRDPEFVDDPDRLDITRDRRHHLAFGHGVHQCIGQHLARLEMRIGFQRLIERFPDLRLAIPAREVPLRTDLDIYGVHALPVTW